MNATAIASVFPATIIVGVGRLGASIGEGLQDAGWPVVLVARRDASAAMASARGFSVIRSLADAAPADLVLLCVPDDALIPVLRELGTVLRVLRPECVVLHTSGAVPVSALRDAAPRGVPIGSLHPLQSVTAQSGAAVLGGAPAAVSGEPGALAMAERVAHALGMNPFRLADEAKPLYHAASAMAANFTVALLDVAIELARAAGMPPEHARIALARLASLATARVAEVETTTALTGPIARGDVGTVRLHLAALRRSAPHIVPLYVEAARCTLQLAARAGLGGDAMRDINAVLDHPGDA